MSFTTIHISCSESEADTLSTLLLDWGYEGTSFENEELQAFVKPEVFDQNKLDELILTFNLKIKAITITEDQNWNQLWEDNFHDSTIDDIIHIRAPFHSNLNYPHEIIIHPKMAFGTGHHGTTRLMMRAMLNTEFKNKSVLDMGCGSGILSILAAQKGAKTVQAIDYDIYSVENSIENAQLNGIENVNVIQADNLDEVTTTFDIILSNIVKNINLNLLPTFSTHLNPGGQLLLCGLLLNDHLEVTNAAKALNLKLDNQSNDGEWLQLTFHKLNE